MTKRTKTNLQMRIAFLALILLAIPLTLFALKDFSPYISLGVGSFFGTKANLVINVTNSAPVSNFSWANLAQGGEERDGMLTEVIPQVRALSPAYIRIDHVFDFYDVVSRDSGGSLVFTWTKLDKELAAIRASGATPFISLSYMPSAISSGSDIDNPRDWNDWRKSVAALVTHISGKNGFSVPNVYYEVWNEPDLFGNFTLSGNKNYLTLYRYSVMGANDAQNVQPFKIGGPATTGLYKSWMNGLLLYTSTNSLRIDFVSWHRYSMFLSAYDDDITLMKSILLAYPQYKDVELVITESGYDSNINKANDGIVSAIQTMAMYTQTFQKIPKIFTFEIKDGPGETQYWGRWGLLTNEKFGVVPKPRYKALEFLNRMKGDWYPVYGQGTWVKAMATTANGVIRILVVNYDPGGFHRENVPISIVNLPSKTFTVKRTDFLGKSTSEEVSSEGLTWITQESLVPNTAFILEITPH